MKTLESIESIENFLHIINNTKDLNIIVYKCKKLDEDIKNFVITFLIDKKIITTDNVDEFLCILEQNELLNSEILFYFMEKSLLYTKYFIKEDGYYNGKPILYSYYKEHGNFDNIKPLMIKYMSMFTEEQWRCLLYKNRYLPTSFFSYELTTIYYGIDANNNVKFAGWHNILYSSILQAKREEDEAK